MVAGTAAELLSVKVCTAGAAPPHAPGPKSMVPVGQPVTLPVPPWPAKASELTLVPHTAPVTVNVEVADEGVVVLGVKPALSIALPPPAMLPEPGDSENCALL